MKQGRLTTSLLALAAMASAGIKGGAFSLPISLVNQRHHSASPPYNQRKARKARRQRWANGDRHAFAR